MITRICKKYTFEACHFLPNHKGACKNVHGHSYKLWVTLEGTPKKNDAGEESGMIIDFNNLDKYVSTATSGFDHCTLNDYYANPTAENMCRDIFTRLGLILKEHNIEATVHKVRLWETEKCYAEVVEG
jgi:6-pyruvoyltetrahydropterin/6-carboxytetrahydropterin synthase